MKLPLVLFILCLFFVGCGSQKVHQNVLPLTYHLLATNNKHTRIYYEGAPLKIFYGDSGRMIKITGRLEIDSTDKILLQRRRGKIIHAVDPGAILSLHRWKQPVVVSMSVLAGLGAIAAWAALSQPNSGLAGLALFAFAVSDGYAVVTVFEIAFISGWLGIRSQRKGYSFSIEADK